MTELGSLGWWQARFSPSDPRPRRLARAFHASYHWFVVHDSASSLCPLTDRDGRLCEIVVGRLDMERAIHGAKLWCGNHYADRDHARIAGIIAGRLPENWAKAQTRRTFAPIVFRELCEGRPCHKIFARDALAQKLNRSTASLDRDRLDFCLIAACLYLDDDAWQKAMEGEEA